MLAIAGSTRHRSSTARRRLLNRSSSGSPVDTRWSARIYARTVSISCNHRYRTQIGHDVEIDFEAWIDQAEVDRTTIDDQRAALASRCRVQKLYHKAFRRHGYWVDVAPDVPPAATRDGWGVSPGPQAHHDRRQVLTSGRPAIPDDDRPGTFRTPENHKLSNYFRHL